MHGPVTVAAPSFGRMIVLTIRWSFAIVIGLVPLAIAAIALWAIVQDSKVH